LTILPFFLQEFLDFADVECETTSLACKPDASGRWTKCASFFMTKNGRIAKCTCKTLIQNYKKNSV